MTPTWTSRLAERLQAELTNLDIGLRLGETAVAAILARAPGPARDLEVQLQAKRVLREGTGRIAALMRDDAEQAAFFELLSAIEQLTQRAA